MSAQGKYGNKRVGCARMIQNNQTGVQCELLAWDAVAGKRCGCA